MDKLSRNNHKVSVWVIEDNDLYRRNLAALLNQNKWINCEHTFSTCEDALEEMQESFSPEIFFVDIGLPGMSGIEGIQQIKRISPTSHIIIITVYDDDQKVFNALCAGASGYLLKSSPDEKIIEAITDVLNGGAPMNAQIARKALNVFLNRTSTVDDYGLTNREKDILGLVVEGLPKKQIADHLHISYYTVDTHIKNIYAKLHVQSSTGAVSKALKERLI
jgi:DNA-binding NarL/FixJ family response regulator